MRLGKALNNSLNISLSQKNKQGACKSLLSLLAKKIILAGLKIWLINRTSIGVYTRSFTRLVVYIQIIVV